MNSLQLPQPDSYVLGCFFQIPNFKDIIEGFREILRLIYGDQAPAWILPLLGYILLGAAVLTGVLALLTIVSKIKDLLTDKFWPIFYNKEKARRSNRRRKFADHIESELRRLNNLEAWSDYRFAELEAEVDAEGQRRLLGILPSLHRTNSTLRREKSLSKALALSEERLIIVEGDPGSGKSVALRHVAILLARRAMASRSAKSLIPIYVNLKEIERKRGEKVDRNLIESFVLKVLNRVNDRDIEEFLEDEFIEGIKNGCWFFLFDSFDEIPEVLSSTEADKSIDQYATAISDFLHGLNQCRGVVASRSFHGPKQFGWARFTLLPLSTKRRFGLVKRASLKPAVEIELLGQIETSGPEFTSMVTNPMFLGLLCEHMRSGYPFPENSHTVFETYLNSRLARDKERLYRRFDLKPEELRATAEGVAFCMAADNGLGLSPSRRDIEISAGKVQIQLDKRFDKILDALTFLKLARADTTTSTDKSQQFTFAHRRFQEYFSTAVVLREPTKVTPRQLLIDARWRETAIVLCQTQTAKALFALLQEAELLVKGFAHKIIKLNVNIADTQENNRHQQKSVSRFQWPQSTLHVLSLLQEGLAKRPNMLSDEAKSNIAIVLTTASEKGTTADQKWGLDVSGLAPASVLTDLLRQAFSNRSQVLRDSAYKQVARLNQLPNDLANSIRSTLCRMTLTRRLRKERTATHAHLARLNNSESYISVLRLLIWLPVIDLILHALLAAIVLVRYVSRVSIPVSPNEGIILVPLFFSMFVILGGYAVLYWGLSISAETSPIYEGRRHATELTEMLLLVFNVRMFVLMLGVLALVGFKQFSRTKLPFTSFGTRWIYIWIYVSFWAPSALLFARRGRFMNPLFWPVYPVLAFITSARAIAPALVLMLRDWQELLIALAVGVLIVAIIAMGVYFGSLIPHIGLILAVGLCTAFLMIVISFTYRKTSDHLKWRQWNRNKVNSITPEEFIETVRSYRSDKYRVRFVNAVRSKGLIVPSSEAEEAIYTFARQLEISSRDLRIESFIAILFFSNSDLGARYGYGVPVLDEVLRLLEQFRGAH